MPHSLYFYFQVFVLAFFFSVSFSAILLLLLLLLLLQVIPEKVNHNYFTLYKASSLNLKIIWSKKCLAFSSFCGAAYCTTKSRFEVVRYSEKWFHLILLKRMDENWSLFLTYKSCPVTCKSCQRDSKINHYSWFLSRGTSRLKKWIYKERHELLFLKRKQQLNNSLQTTELRIMSCWAN